MKLLIFLLPMLLHYPTLNAFFFKSSILVTIEKYWYIVGDYVEIYCQTTDGVYNDLYFSELASGIPLNSENYSVKTVNEDTIQLQLYNVTAGKYNFICQNNKSEKTLLNIGVASFEVGYPPEIKNILFEIIDFKELNVYMSPRIKDINEYWKTTWKFREDIMKEPMNDECLCLNVSQSCLCMNPFYCNISEENCFNPNRTYQFTILGSNHFGVVNRTYIISPMKEVEKLKNLKNLVGVSSLSLSWSWKLQGLWPSTVVECKVSYKLQTEEWKSYFTNSNNVTLNNFVPSKIYTCSSV